MTRCGKKIPKRAMCGGHVVAMNPTLDEIQFIFRDEKISSWIKVPVSIDRLIAIWRHFAFSDFEI